MSDGPITSPEQSFEHTSAFTNRRTAVFEALSDPNIRSMDQKHKVLSKLWMDELRDDIDTSVARATQRGSKNAVVMQFADGNLDYDAPFINAYFRKLGAHVTTPTGEQLEVNSRSVRTLAQSKSLPSVQVEFLGDIVNKSPQGSFVVEEVDRKTLVVETTIEGVRLVLEGPAITNPNHIHIRPMLLLRIDDAPLEMIVELPKTKEVVRRTWREVHRRDPDLGKAVKTQYEQKLQSLAQMSTRAGEAEIINAGLSWQMEAKSGDEILVTPTSILENPTLQTDQERLATIQEALQMATDNMRLGTKGRQIVGAMNYGFAFIVDILKMTPEEIIRDGEGMSDLVEYLKEAGSAKPNTFAHSEILGPPSPGDPFGELAKKIEETWDFPKSSAFNFPLVKERISWTKRSQSQPGLN